MSKDVQLKVSADISDAKKSLESLQKTITQTQNRANRGNRSGGGGAGGFSVDSIKNALRSKFSSSVDDIVSSSLGRFGSIGKNLASVGRGALAAGGGYAAAAAGALALPAALAYNGIRNAEQGRAHYNQERSLNASLGQIQRNLGGSGYVSGMTKSLISLGQRGKVPLENLEEVAKRLMLAFKGDQQAALEFTEIIADISVATGASTDELSEMITRVRALGKAEESVVTGLDEKGIPVYKALATQLGVSVDEARELAKQGKITADEFERAVKAANQLSSQNANTAAAIKDANYWNTQTQNLQNKVYADSYTARMEETDSRWARRRYESEQEYYNDASVRNMHDNLAEAAQGIAEAWEWACSVVRDATNNLLTGFAQATDWLMSFTGYHENKAQSAINQGQSRNRWWSAGVSVTGSKEAYAMRLDPSDSVVRLSEEIAKTESYIAEQRALLNERYVDDDQKELIRQQIAIDEENLRLMQRVKTQKQELIAEEQRRVEAARVAADLQQKALREGANGPADLIQAWNLTNSDKVGSTDEMLRRYNEATSSIRNGTGTAAQQEYISFFQKAVDAIDRRERFELQRGVSRGDAGSRFALELMNAQKEMRSLGYSAEEIESISREMRSDASKSWSEKLSESTEKVNELQSKLDNIRSGTSTISQAIAGRGALFDGDYVPSGTPTKMAYERGAWGQGLAMEMPDEEAAKLLEQQRILEEQLRVQEEQRSIAEKQLEAIREIDVTPRAR